jgi:hypothetical protein
MRLVRLGLIAIALLASCRLAQADIQTICATIAGNSANPMLTNVDLWLTGFRKSYAACLSQHGAAVGTGVATEVLKEISAVKPGREKPAAKPVNTTPAIKEAEIETGKKSSPEISPIEKKLSKPKHPSEKPAVARAPKKTRVPPAPPPVTLASPATKVIRAQKTNLPDAHTQGETITCTPRFGPFSKFSQTALAVTWKCVRKQNNFNE